MTWLSHGGLERTLDGAPARSVSCHGAYALAFTFLTRAARQPTQRRLVRCVQRAAVWCSLRARSGRSRRAVQPAMSAEGAGPSVGGGEQPESVVYQEAEGTR